MTATPLGWVGIARLGLVQAALGAIVVLTTSTLNRVMVVEFSLPAILPGALVALHYGVQLLRPCMGFGSDVGGRSTPWIVGGMALLTIGGITSAAATALMGAHRPLGILLAVPAFASVGLGVGAAGTSVLVVMAKQVGAGRRAQAATTLWLLMILGIAVSAIAAGKLLDPFSPARLIRVVAAIDCAAFLLSLGAIRGVERQEAEARPVPYTQQPPFLQALGEIWRETQSRRFAMFVFISMLAYSAQELILEPYAGSVFGLTPGQSAKLTALQHGGVLVGMLVVAIGGSFAGEFRTRAMRGWTIAGCAGSALALAALAIGGLFGRGWPLRETVFALGIANGAFTISAIGAMMGLASQGQDRREGTRMGLWGAAQAIAFGVGGLAGTGASDIARRLVGSPSLAYAAVFVGEAIAFLIAARLAAQIFNPQSEAAAHNPKLRRARGQRPSAKRSRPAEKEITVMQESFDVVVVGGGPAGATAATDLAQAGRTVLLLDRAGRIKPCGGAIPPRLIKDFDIPDALLVAKARAARMVAPSDKEVDMPIEGGFVGMVDREHFDEWLRERAAETGCVRATGDFTRVDRDEDGTAIVEYACAGLDQPVRVRARTVIGADGAKSTVAKQCVPGADHIKYVFAYHEIVRTPKQGGDMLGRTFEGQRCDIYYQGRHSPDFYGWVFPHGETTSVGSGSARKGFSLRRSVTGLRAAAGLGEAETIRREGAPIPMRPMKRWDNGRDVVLAGDAAGVVAPASGEGIYYAMAAGRMAAAAVEAFFVTGRAESLRLARKKFMKAHGRVFLILGIMQWFWYSNDKRRERFVSICRDKDVQKLTWDAYMNKELVRSKPAAHAKIFFKDLAHLFGVVAP